jgi:hypothetical protein
MNAMDIRTIQSTKKHTNAGKMLLQIISILLLAYLAFFLYVASHELVGHILGDSLVFGWHGTTFTKINVIVQWLTLNLQDGRWSVGLAPFRIGGKVVSAIPRDLFTLSDWDRGFGDLSGSAMTFLLSLIALTVLNLRKNIRHFPWFIVFFSLSSVIFDQLLYTFTGPDPEPLVSAVRMGANPLLFKLIVIILVLLQGWLLVRFVLRYQQARRASISTA